MALNNPGPTALFLMLVIALKNGATKAFVEFFAMLGGNKRYNVNQLEDHSSADAPANEP